MFKKILLAYDGSESARHAFKRCLELARSSGGSLAIVTVIGARELALDAGVQTALDVASAQLSSELARLERRACVAGVEAVPMICVGRPAREITRAAAEWHADLIVTGRHGRRSLIPWFPGHTSSQLIARAPCAVLTVR